MTSAFPIVRLRHFETGDAATRQRIAAEVDEICRTTGFLAIAEHGIAPEVIADAWDKAKMFFDQPAETKQQVKVPYPGYPFGYMGPGSEALAASRGMATPPDLKESFNGGPPSVPPGLTDADALAFCYAPTPWPDAPQGFREAWAAYYAALEDLASRIMTLFAAALGLPDDFFANKIDHPVSALRALNYPEVDVAPAPGQLRAGAHSDYGSLTILLPQPGSEGLQIEQADGSWRDVPPIPGAFVINIGDLMARWTNERWVSTVHRVVNPSRPEAAEARRQSFAYFHQANWFANIECLDVCLAPGETPKHPPVLSGPYLMSKFKSTVAA
ncbi:isopenicillin N synthase family dioxygenase [Devosia sp.]|uniref:isopenicillin N synthase family dioxygenase n=1 Tax=Devosia sp. TaxID=1871048 RepID=UPI003A8F5F40